MNKDRERKWNSTFLRKIRKPIVERKRRNRINKCLLELKEILLENMKRNGDTQVAKLDKADILEMTVQHLRQVQQQKQVVMATQASCLQQYHHGFSECAQETLRYMQTSGSYPGVLASSMNEHLSNMMSGQYSEQSLNMRIVKTENMSGNSCETPQRKCRSASPPICVSKRLQFSPLSRNALGRHITERMSLSTSNLNSDLNSQNSILMIPPRLPAGADDASPQRNVWRPF